MLIFSSPPSLLFLGLEDVTKNVVSNVQNVLKEKKFLSLKHDIIGIKSHYMVCLPFPLHLEGYKTHQKNLEDDKRWLRNL